MTDVEDPRAEANLYLPTDPEPSPCPHCKDPLYAADMMSPHCRGCGAGSDLAERLMDSQSPDIADGDDEYYDGTMWECCVCHEAQHTGYAHLCDGPKPAPEKTPKEEPSHPLLRSATKDDDGNDVPALQVLIDAAKDDHADPQDECGICYAVRLAESWLKDPH